MMRRLIALCAVALAAWAPMADAGDTPMSGRFAGTVINGFQLDSSGNPSEFIVSEAEMKGSLGATRLSVLSQFVPDFSLTVCQPDEIATSMVYARSVMTFQDMSVLYASFDKGWLCIKPGPAGVASYYGKVSAQVVGGTGRMEGASGHLESDFYGHDLAGPFVVNCPTCAPEVPFPAYGSFVGTMTGKLVLPK
jgi:hypothetical protein